MCCLWSICARGRRFRTFSLIGCSTLTWVTVPQLLALICCILHPRLVCDYQLLLLLIAVLLTYLQLILIVIWTLLPWRISGAAEPVIVVSISVLIILNPQLVPVRLEVLVLAVPLSRPLWLCVLLLLLLHVYRWCKLLIMLLLVAGISGVRLWLCSGVNSLCHVHPNTSLGFNLIQELCDGHFQGGFWHITS